MQGSTDGGRDALAGLDDVDWGALSHAGGAAIDVPAMLRALRSGDAGARDEAYEGLYHAVLHQGTVYPATVAAVPFLSALAADPAVPARAAILEYLGWVVPPSRQDWWAEAERDSRVVDTVVEQTMDELRPLSSSANYARLRNIIRAEVVSYWRVHDAAHAAIPIYLRLLSDDDFAVRRAVAWLLTHFPDDRAAILPAARSRLDREDDACTRATLARCLGDIGGAPGEGQADGWCVARCRALLDEDPAPDVRLAAAIALLHLLPQGPDEGALRMVGRAYADPVRARSVDRCVEPPILDTLAGSASSVAHAGQYTVLARLRPEDATMVAGELIAVIDGPLSAREKRELTERAITLLHRYPRASASDAPALVARRRDLLRRGGAALVELLADPDTDDWEAWYVAKVAVALLYYEHATDDGEGGRWLDRARDDALAAMAGQRFWRRDNFHVMAFAHRALSAVYVEAAGRPERAASEGGRALIGAVVAALPGWGRHREKRDVEDLLARHGDGGQPG